VTGDFKQKIKIYAAQHNLTMQEVADLALKNLLKTKTVGHYYAALNKTAPVLLMVRVPKSTLERAVARAAKDHVSFPDFYYTALARLVDNG
jgi:hypothetical protein